jgi:integrase
MAKKTKMQTENLPKGISFRKNENRYIGRVTYKGKTYIEYDTNVGRLDRTLNQLRKDLEAGKDIEARNQTLNEWFDTWMKIHKSKTVKIGTYENYRRHYNYYVREGIGKKKLKDVNIDDIQGLFNSFADKGFSKGMIKLVAATLNGCFRKAILNRMIEFNPVEFAEIPIAKEKKKSIALTVEIQKAFMMYAKESYLYPLFKIALMSGTRNGELRGMRWCDISFEHRELNVNHTIIWIEGQGNYLDLPKTKSSKRVIPLNEDMLIYLGEIKQSADNMGLGKPDDYVFCLPDGKPISRYRVTSELNKIQARMKNDDYNIKHFTCHALRHTYSTRATENGVTYQNLKELLGHSQLSVTMDLYSHVTDDVKRSEMNKLNGVF